VAVELIALLGAVGEAVRLVKDTAQAVGEIRSGRFNKADNEEAKRKLEAALGELQTRLAQVGELARVAQEYGRTHREVIELLSLTRRAEQVLSDGRPLLESPTNAGYEGTWKLVDALFLTIEANGDIARLVAMDRARWYSERDKGQIQASVDQYRSAYLEARRYVRTKSVREALHEVRDMASALQDAESALKSTSDEILSTLQTLDTLRQ
jgi:hypothetical protein